MAKLLMITGDRSLAEGKRGAFYNTLEEFHKYWKRIDIICPKANYINAEIPNPPPAPRIRRAGKSQIPNKSEIQNSKPETMFGNVFIHPSRWPLFFQPFWILKKGHRLYRENRFDLMTVHEYPPFYNGIGARLLWKKNHVPYILQIMHIPGYPKAANLKERFYKWLVRRFIKFDAKKAAKVAVINQKQTPDFLIKAGLSKDKILYIPAFYIDLEIFKPIAEEKKYDLVFAARLEKNKGIGLLLEAIRNVKLQNPNIKLLIIGSGPLKENVKFKIENLKLHDNVVLAGWLETSNDVARAYNSARIFVNPSFNEGGPRVVLEAMACGLPIITTPVGLMPDIIKDKENGLFTGWEPQEMAGKILFLLNNPELQAKFSSAGLEVVKQFEKKSAIQNFAGKLQNLLKREENGAPSVNPISKT